MCANMSDYSVLRQVKRMVHAISSRSAVLEDMKLRLTWSLSRRAAKRVPDEAFAYRCYKEHTGQDLNLTDPQTFDDKVWYLKLHNRDPLLTICSDKYRVREYVEQCGLGHILNELYGVYDDAREIDFDKIQSPCFLKCNHTSGTNIIFDQEKPFDQKRFIRRFNFMLKQNYYWASREWNYKDIQPKIIAEKVLRDKDGKLPLDYKFMCFHGEPKIMYLSANTCSEAGSHSPDQCLNYYDMDFHQLPITGAGMKNIEGTIEKVDTFETMKEYAAILSKPFSFCRVDFYSVDGKIYFGEITFYPTGGCQNLQPPEWSMRVGSWIDLRGISKS